MPIVMNMTSPLVWIALDYTFSIPPRTYGVNT